MTRKPRFSIAALALGLALLAAPGLAQETCLSDAEIQAAVSNGTILPVARVLEREGIAASTQVLSVRVCGAGGQLNYVLAVLGASGAAQNLTVSAR